MRLPWVELGRARSFASAAAVLGLATPSVWQQIRFETSTKELLLQYVRMNFGIAVVPISPRFQADADAPYGDIRNLAFRDLSSVFGVEHIVILRRRHRHEPDYQRAFREIVMKSLREGG
jgi:DNA-binding transcriptional LysR family regulator